MRFSNIQVLWSTVRGINIGEELFDKIEQSHDFTSVRVEAWDSTKDLEEMTLSELHELIDERIRLLGKYRYDSIGVVGKSFGSQLALTSKHEAGILRGVQHQVLDKTMWKNGDLPC